MEKNAGDTTATSPAVTLPFVDIQSPHVVASVPAAVVDDSVFVVGGFGWNEPWPYLTNVEVLQPPFDRGTVVASLAVQRSETTAAELGRMVYAVGGSTVH